MSQRAFTLTLFLCLLQMQVCLAQERKKAVKKESYKSLQSRSSVNQATQLLKEADNLKVNDPSSALDKVQEALAMSIAQKDAFSEGKSYVLLGEINEGIQEWKLALENYTRAHEKLGEENADSEQYKKALEGLGAMNLKLGIYNEALKYFQESLSLDLSRSERLDRQLDISETYYQMGNYDQALKVLNESPRSKVVDQSYDTRVENQKAKIYARQNNLNLTRQAYQNSLNSAAGQKLEPKAVQSLQDTKEDIASVLNEEKKYDDEINVRQQAIKFNLENKNAVEVTKDKVAIGQTLEKKGESEAALKETEEAVTIADTISNAKEQAKAYLALADLYQKNGRTQNALATYRKYAAAVNRSEKQNEIRLTEKSELIKKQKDIEELTSSVSIGQRDYALEQQTVSRQRLIIYGLLGIIAIIGVTSFFIYKNAMASKRANQLLALKSLRSQMNPHFIFNALNSVNHFIATQDERAANQFLSEFSQLMRLVLENSQQDFISLQKEQEILSLYLKLEHYRFRDKFDYEINLDPSLNAESIEVPPMLIQPYLENAVWHGLRYKETKGKLSLRISKQDHNLVAEVCDDGIGRKRSAELKTENQKKHFSMGLKNIGERLVIINKMYKANYHVSVEDPKVGTGTEVKIYMPLRNHLN
ncbi:MAG: histidine kinase [Bacteroidetes bacterium]|nr:histidine kinase [Bacteroidota bacterium]MBI3483250.1 histidine kinase [Bacteroidota bacterium]